jgi:hypothetical protein
MEKGITKMKVDFNSPLLDPRGKIVYEVRRDATKQKSNAYGQLEAQPVIGAEGLALLDVVTLSDVVIGVLQDNYEGDDRLPGRERIHRQRLSDRVFNGETEFDVYDLTLIQELAAKKRSTLVLGRLDEVINPKDAGSASA